MPESSPDSLTTSSKPVKARAWISNPLWMMIFQAFLSALILLAVCNPGKVYEEDLMAKASMVSYLAENSNWTHYHDAPDYYSRDVFSAYYFAGLAMYKCIHPSSTPDNLTNTLDCDAIRALNWLSILCGVVFFAATPLLLRRVFDFPPWLTWLVLVNTPIFIISFTYGNEAALALACVVVCGLLLSIPSSWTQWTASFFYVVAAYSRNDYLFLWPALVLITLSRLPRENFGRGWKIWLRNVAPFLSGSALFGVLYLVLVLKHLPSPEFAESLTTFKVFAAFLIYTPNPLFFCMSAIGLVMCFVPGRRFHLLALLACVHFAPYFFHFGSPKYILPSIVVLLIFAIVAIQPIWKRIPWLVCLMMAIPWFVAVTPFGVFGPARAAYWCFPTDDGPLPTGGYLNFYLNIRKGLYQQRYDQEYQQIAEVMPRIEELSEQADIVGYFNPGALRTWATRRKLWRIPPKGMVFWKSDGADMGSNDRPCFMIKTTYLYGFKQRPDLRQSLKQACLAGAVSALAETPQDPLPDVIQLSGKASAAKDSELGSRILFMNSYFEGNQIFRRKSFISDWHAVTWIPRGKFESLKLTTRSDPIYRDSQWVCLRENVEGGIYYSTRFPMQFAAGRKQIY